MVRWFVGSLVRWFVGSLVRSVGLSVCRSVGLSVCQSVSLSVCRSVGRDILVLSSYLLFVPRVNNNVETTGLSDAGAIVWNVIPLSVGC